MKSEQRLTGQVKCFERCWLHF